MPGAASGIIAGAAFVKLTLDGAELNKGLKESQSMIKRFTSSVNDWSTKVALNSAMMQVPFVKAIEVFQDFDLKMRQVKAITGATSQVFSELSEQARKLGRETSFTTSQVADAMVALGRLGFSANEIKKTVRPVMNLAKATGTDLGEAAMVAGNNMRVFGIEAEKLESVTDVMVATVNSSAQTLQDFAEASAKAGPNFVNTGADIKEMSASLGILANMGIRGSIAGTALSRAIKRLADPNVISFLKSYGIETEDANKNMKPLHENLAQIARVMNTLSHSERIHIAEEIFEVRGSLAGLPLTSNVKAIDEFLSKLRQCGGVASRTANEMDSGIYGAIKRLESAFNDVYISLGKFMDISFIDWINTCTKWVNELNKADNAFKELGGIVLKTGIIFAMLGGAAKMLAMIVDATKALFQPIMFLNNLIMGTERAAEAAAAAEEKRNLQIAASEAQRIAAEKEATAEALKASAAREAALLQEKKAQAKLAQKAYTEGQGNAAGANTAIASANEKYKKNYAKQEAIVDAKRWELNLITAQNAELEKKVTLANADLEAAERAEHAAQKNYGSLVKRTNETSERLSGVQAGNAAAVGTSASVNANRVAMEQAEAAKKAADEKVVALQRSINKTNEEIKANAKLIATRKGYIEQLNKEYKAGVKNAAGRAKIMERNLANAELEKQSLNQKLIMQKDSLKLAEKEAQTAGVKFRTASNVYAGTAVKSSGKTVDTKAIEDKLAQQQAEVSVASGAMSNAQVRTAAAKAQLADARAQLDAQNALVASKQAEINSIQEKMALGRAERDEAITAQETIKAKAQETNVALKEQARIATLEANEQERAAMAAKRKADAAIADASKARAGATAATNTANAYGATPVQDTSKNQAELVAAQEEVAANRRIAAEKQVTLAKATERRIQLQSDSAYIKAIAANHEAEIALNQQSIVNAQEARQATIAESEAQMTAMQMGIETDMASIQVKQQKIATLEAEKQAVIDLRNASNSGAQKGMYTEKINSINTEIAALNTQITKIQERVAVEEAEFNTIQTNMNQNIAQQETHIQQLQKELELRGMLSHTLTNTAKASNVDVINAMNSEANAKVALNQANKAVIASEQRLAVAQRLAMTKSQKYSKVFVNAGHGRLFAAACSKKHANQILKTSASDVYATALVTKNSKIRAALYFAETVAAKDLADATIGVEKAQTGLAAAGSFLASHAVTVAMIAIAGIMALVKKHSENAVKAVDGLTTKYRQNAEAASKATESTRQSILAEQEQIQYLVDLEKRGSATQEQQEAALSIIEMLGKKYQNFNIILDKTTGKLSGAYKAQMMLNEEQKKALIEKTKQELKEYENTANASLKGQIVHAKKESSWWANNHSIGGVNEDYKEILEALGYNFTPAKYAAEKTGRGIIQISEEKWENPFEDTIAKSTLPRLEALKKDALNAFNLAQQKGINTKQFEDLLAYINKVIDARKELQRLENGNFTGKEQKKALPPVKVPDAKEIEDAQKRIAEMDKKNADIGISNLQKELEAIQKMREEYEKYIALLEQAANAKRNNAMSNIESTRNMISEKRNKVNSLEWSNTNGKNNEEITRLNSEITKLVASIQRYTNDIKASDKQLEELKSKRENMNKEYNYQQKFSEWSNRVKEQKAYRDDARLTQRWRDYSGNWHESDMSESFMKWYRESLQNDKYTGLMENKDYAGALKMMKSLVTSSSYRWQRATEDYNALLKKAKDNGYYDGTMNKTTKMAFADEMQRLAQAVKEWQGKNIEYRNKVDEVKKAQKGAVSDQKGEAIGSFSARALSRSIGGDGLQMKMLTAENEQVKVAGIISTNLRNAYLQIKNLNERLGLAN